MSDESAKILYLDTVDSTNRYSSRKIKELPDRQIVLAEKQTAGQGRLNRTWVSNWPDNLYMSLVLKEFPNVDPPLINLSQYMALKVAELLADYSVDAHVKWPNDVLVRGKKIAGVLGEAVYQGLRLQGYILGLGVNLNMNADDITSINQPATSLNLLIRRHVNRDRFLETLLTAFFQEYASFLLTGFPFIRHRFLEKTPFLGKEITIKSESIPVSGIAKDINRNGSLVLFTGEEDKTITLGDVEC